MASSCWCGLCDLLRRGGQSQEEKRAKFETIILFLASVPLFRKQLPRAELPKLAQRLTERTWAPGKKLVKEGETGRTFFLIYSGRAAVMTQDAEGKLTERAELSEGDWLGGHTLTSERPNVATIVAKGPEPLVTLEMTKRDFEESGLQGKLHCPKRPAMRVRAPEVELALGMAKDGDHSAAQTPEEQDFIISSISQNPNLRGMAQSLGPELDSLEKANSALRELAKVAVRRQVAKGTEVARSGDLGQEFFVIRQGSFEVVVNPSSTGTAAKRSAESAASSASLAERIRRKQDFLTGLHRPLNAGSSAIKHRGSYSVMMTDPREAKKVPMMRGQFASASLKGGEVTGSASESPTRASSSQIQVVAGPQVAATLSVGDSFGELSLLYNTRREATFRAAEDSVVYVMSRRQFKQLAGRWNGRKQFQECCNLLDEVDTLTPLLRAERRELATNFVDQVFFKPGQRILTQGKVRESALWYVVFSGSAILSQDSPAATSGRLVVGEISRGGHFGERSLLEHSSTGSPTRCKSEVNVDAGPNGLKCITFDGELIRDLLQGLTSVEMSNLPSMTCDAATWEKEKLSRVRVKSIKTIAGIDEMKEVCLLGKGGFGTVFLVRDPNKQLFALKRISKGLAVKTEVTQQLCWEKDLLSMLASPFIIKLYGTYRDAQFVYLLLEVGLGGDLYTVFHKETEIFLEDQPRGSSTAFYAACIIAGLEHLHERRIVYRDCKPENVLLDVRGYGKICDMGLARFVCGKTNTQVGTPDYMAPEMIDPPHYHDFSADWWALGVMTFELLNRQTPFDDDGLDDPQERLLAIRRSQETGSYGFTYDCPALAKNFIERLLRRLPSRLGAEGGATSVRAHSWFKKFDFDALHAQKLRSPIELPWKESADLEKGGLHSDELPVNDDLFVLYESDDTGWDADFQNNVA